MVRGMMKTSDLGNVLRVVQGFEAGVLVGPKVLAFYRNIIGDPSPVTPWARAAFACPPFGYIDLR